MLRRTGPTLRWAGSKGAGLGAPTRGLGRFFQRTRVVMGGEPMFVPRELWFGMIALDGYTRPVWDYWTGVMAFLFTFFVTLPAAASLTYYYTRTFVPSRAASYSGALHYNDLDDPDWRLKAKMQLLEQSAGPRPVDYNRFLDPLKGVKVSDPSFKIYIPSEHGEAVGAHAGDILRNIHNSRVHRG